MYRFWECIIRPCFELAGVKKVVEIGAQNGYMTKKLAEYAVRNDGLAVSVDPFPLFDYKKMQEDFSPHFKMYGEMSLQALPKLGSFDAILIDGDHNWYTVYNELRLVKQFCGDKLPLIFLHDVSWPYARRDLYYNPDTIPAEYRHSYAKKGIVSGQSELSSSDGINFHLCNALDEGTPRNGVLTAIEDFIAENKNLSFHLIDCVCGLGFIYEKGSAAPLLEHMQSAETLAGLIRLTEEQRIEELHKRSRSDRQKENDEEEIHRLSSALKSRSDEIDRLHADIAFLTQKNEKANKWADELENSYRFRAGSIMFESLSSPKRIIKMPFSLARLAKQYKRGDRPDSDSARRKKRLKYFRPYYHGKEELIEYAAERLLSKKTPLASQPLVSIIIISRNGLKNLQVLFKSLENVSYYRNIEIIFVDNGSTDGTFDFLKEREQVFDIKIIKNKENLSFSAANNRGAAKSRGDYLLFLNNDIEVTENWLDEMLLAAQSEKCGAVGAKLIYPEIPDSAVNKGKSYLVQHKGICFEDSDFDGEFFLRPYNIGNCDDPIDIHDEDITEKAVVTAACMLVSRKAFEDAGRFDERYIYGYEDVDLCLKLYRKGYRNYCCNTAMLFHYEFGTQEDSQKSDIIERRCNNIRVFRNKWQKWLKSEILSDKLSARTLFTEAPLTVALAVTESKPDTSAGDFFTAMELAESLKKLGWNIRYLDRKGSTDWYDVGEDVDVIISLLEAYDITKVRNVSPRLISVAWARNWFDRWCDKPYIRSYNCVFASSKTACAYMERSLGRRVELFPIATNSSRFTDIPQLEGACERFSSDYVFTGSYWNDPREIMDILNPAAGGWRFRVFGANWEQTEKFRDYTGGFVSYADMPQIYKHTRIVIDDANRATKPYGAVNSRVFDAIAAGKLVLTNGVIGAEETFEGMLPHFENSEELEALLNLYMTDEKAYSDKVAQLRDFVLEKHTYDARAVKLREILSRLEKPDDKRIAILAPVPKWEERNSWGDFHFAEAMKKCFEKRGYTAEIRILPDWDIPFDGKYVIVLRGLSVYKPCAAHINIMWNISHPDDVPATEYNEYDMVYISSVKWADEIRSKVSTRVEALMQCSDADVFHPDEEKSEQYANEILFVGNSRKIFRRVISDVMPPEYGLSVYGADWEKLIDAKYIKGRSISNSELYRYYSGCAVLLNDHWDDMREKGFVSNRLFDAAASGAFVISDYMPEIHDIFGDCIVTYKNREELHEKIRFYMTNPDERRKIASAGRELVAKNHTFENRTAVMLGFIEEAT